MNDYTNAIFRIATRADVSGIHRLLSDDIIGREREAPAEQLQVYERAFDAIANDPNNEIVVADFEGRVVGCVQLTFTPGLARRGAMRATLEGIRVATDLRGAGLGGSLLKYAISLAQERGAQIVQLTTDTRRTDSHRFYERLGFVASHVGMKLEL